MSRVVRTVACAAALVCGLWATPAQAHPVPFSYLDLRLTASALEASLVVHTIDVAHELGIDTPETLLDPNAIGGREAAIGALIAKRLRLEADGLPLVLAWTRVETLADRQALRLSAAVALPRAAGTVAVDGVLFPYDPNHRTFVNVYEGDDPTQAILDAGRTRFEYFAGTRQGAVAVVRRFVPAGIHHILIGPDHILFLVGLLLLGGSFKRLALIVTGFTLAHSVTLSLAALGILRPPASLIEPAIALSIVFVGADNLLKKDGRDIRAWIAFGFGFIHGFGFANVLAEMDLPARALGWSLFSFNLGVEVGQLAIVGAVASVFGAIRSKSEIYGRRLAVAGSVLVMAAGTFWFTERILFPGGM